MLGNYLQQTTSAEVIFQMHFFLALYGLKSHVQDMVPDYLPLHSLIIVLVYFKGLKIHAYMFCLNYNTKRVPVQKLSQSSLHDP